MTEEDQEEDHEHQDTSNACHTHSDVWKTNQRYFEIQTGMLTVSLDVLKTNDLLRFILVFFLFFCFCFMNVPIGSYCRSILKGDGIAC